MPVTIEKLSSSKVVVYLEVTRYEAELEYNPDSPTHRRRWRITAENGTVQFTTSGKMHAIPALLVGERRYRLVHRALDDEDLVYVAELLADAAARGYPGPPEALRAYIEQTIKEMRDLDDEFAESGQHPEALLRAIAEAGGLSVTRDPENRGELLWLKDHLQVGPFGSVRGVRGVFQSSGLSPDGIVEALGQEPRFYAIRTINDLLRALQATAHAKDDAVDVPSLLKRAGIVRGRVWWTHLDTSV